MDCSLPVSSIHGIFQARVLEWVAISFSRGSSWPRDQTYVSCMGRRILYHWATMKPSKEQAYFNFVAAVTVQWFWSPRKWSVTVSVFSPSICYEVMGPGITIFIFDCWVLSHLFHSPLSPSQDALWSLGRLGYISGILAETHRMKREEAQEVTMITVKWAVNTECPSEWRNAAKVCFLLM